MLSIRDFKEHLSAFVSALLELITMPNISASRLDIFITLVLNPLIIGPPIEGGILPGLGSA